MFGSWDAVEQAAYSYMLMYIVIPGPDTATDTVGRTTTICFGTYLWLLCDEYFLIPRLHQRGYGVGIDPGYRNSVALLQLRRFIVVGIYPTAVYFPAYGCGP